MPPLWLWRVNPEIYAARRRIHPGTKRWDVILLCLLLPSVAAILPVAALDARFRWHPLPLWTSVLGDALLLAGIGITAWAQAVNDSGEAYLTPALIDGRWAVRVSIGSAATEHEHVEGLWRLMRRMAAEATSPAAN